MAEESIYPPKCVASAGQQGNPKKLSTAGRHGNGFPSMYKFSCCIRLNFKHAGVLRGASQRAVQRAYARKESLGQLGFQN